MEGARPDLRHACDLARKVQHPAHDVGGDDPQVCHGPRDRGSIDPAGERRRARVRKRGQAVHLDALAHGPVHLIGHPQRLGVGRHERGRVGRTGGVVRPVPDVHR